MRWLILLVPLLMGMKCSGDTAVTNTGGGSFAPNGECVAADCSVRDDTNSNNTSTVTEVPD